MNQNKYIKSIKKKEKIIIEENKNLQIYQILNLIQIIIRKFLVNNYRIV